MRTILWCFNLLVITCQLSVFLACGGGSVAREVTGKESSNSKESLDSPGVDTTSVVKAVAERYGGLKYYRSGGLNQYSSNFNGDEKVQPDTSFEIEYVRGRDASIRWQAEGRSNIFRIGAQDSWLEVDGRSKEKFSDPSDGLGVVTLAERGGSRFLIDVFVFRDELRMGERFFAELVDSKVTEERELDGRMCYLLYGTYRDVEGGSTYWIDKESSVIRRIEKVIIIRKVFEGKEYVNTARTTETYSDIEIR